MREHFASAWIETDYEVFIKVIDLPDPDDRHVVAAAIAGSANYIVVDDTRHFPSKEPDRFGLEVGTADAFLAGTFEHCEGPALNVVREHRAGLRAMPSATECLVRDFQLRLSL